jgi:hypothetical protein
MAAQLSPPAGATQVIPSTYNNFPIYSSGVYEIADGFTGTIHIAGYGLDVHLKQATPSQPLTGVTIECNRGTNLFIEDLNIINTYSGSAILFKHGENTLNLIGTNNIQRINSNDDIYSLIAVSSRDIQGYLAELTINSAAGHDGTLNASINGDVINSAVIGGGNGGSLGGSGVMLDCGTITIAGGTINAKITGPPGSYSHAAVIGGAANGSGGTINITGGNVTAVNNMANEETGQTGVSSRGAVIGNGVSSRDGGVINISGGNVRAEYNGTYGEGAIIGGGHNGGIITGGSVNITGGEVWAEFNGPLGGFEGPAVGCGYSEDANGVYNVTVDGGQLHVNGSYIGTGRTRLVHYIYYIAAFNTTKP